MNSHRPRNYFISKSYIYLQPLTDISQRCPNFNSDTPVVTFLDDLSQLHFFCVKNNAIFRVIELSY